MAYSEANKRAVAKYSAKTYDDVRLRVKKGQREAIKTYAESKGYSLNGYLVHLIEQDMGEKLGSSPSSENHS